MASLTITVPDAQVPRLRAAFAYRLGLDVADVTAEVVRQQLVENLKVMVRAAERDLAEQQARDAVLNGADIEAS